MGTKNKPKLVVCGAAGRMGRRIIALAAEDGCFEIVGAIEKAGQPDVGKDAGVMAGVAGLNIRIADDFAAKADIVIDFSLPEATDRTIDYCVNNGTALILGTTGISDKQQEKLSIAAGKIPVLCATNMSVGMNTLFSLAGKVALMLGDDYDIEIVEKHHRFKKDAPSGSALTLAKNICNVTGRPCPDSLVSGRAGKDVQRARGQIGIHAVRAGDIAGVHSVIFSTMGETLTLEHTAHSRDTFARGTLRAAEWLLDKKPGFYSMADVLGMK